MQRQFMFLMCPEVQNRTQVKNVPFMLSRARFLLCKHTSLKSQPVNFFPRPKKCFIHRRPPEFLSEILEDFECVKNGIEKIDT